jgi:hypothetical protein
MFYIWYSKDIFIYYLQLTLSNMQIEFFLFTKLLSINYVGIIVFKVVQ